MTFWNRKTEIVFCYKTFYSVIANKCGNGVKHIRIIYHTFTISNRPECWRFVRSRQQTSTERENGEKQVLIPHNGFLRAKCKRVNISLFPMFSRDVLMLGYWLTSLNYITHTADMNQQKGSKWRKQSYKRFIDRKSTYISWVCMRTFLICELSGVVHKKILTIL